MRGALLSVLLAHGTFFLLRVRGEIFFASGAQCVFLCAAGARRVFFFAAGVCGAVCFLLPVPGAGRAWRLDAEAGGCVFFFIWARGGMMGLRRRVHVFAAGARRACLFFAAAAGGFRVRNSEGGLSYTWSH